MTWTLVPGGNGAVGGGTSSCMTSPFTEIDGTGAADRRARVLYDPPVAGVSPVATSSRTLRQGAAHQRLRLGLDATQVLLAAEALGVELVDVLGARRPRGEPAALRLHLQAADGCAIAGRSGERARDRLAGELGVRHVARRQLRQDRLLLARGRCVDTLVDRSAELLRQLGVQLARVAAGDGGHLGGEEPADDAVLVGGPD